MKRDGRHQPISFDKILQRIGALTHGLDVDAAYVAQQVVSQIFPGVKTTVLDEFSAQICAHLQTDHPDYGVLAVRLVISNNHKETSPRFSEAMRKAYTNYEKDGRHNPLISERLWTVIRENADEIDGWVRHEADYEYDYFGFQTLLKSYLLRQDGQVIERPQYMLLRVSLGLWYENLEGARRSYTKLSQLYFTHATPTLFHAGSQRPQLSSCFLLGTHDSIDGIYKTITDCAKISKWAGGIGIHASEIRGKGAKIKGTQGTTDGIIPMLRVYNETARYVNQCFAAGAMIVTRQGLAPIESITEGTMVLTGANTWEPVLGLMERAIDKESKDSKESKKSDVVYELRTHLSKESVVVTGEHEVWALRCQGSRGNLYAMRSLVKKKRIQPRMVKVSELNLDDYVGFPVEEPGDVIDEAKINERDVYDGFVWWRAETVPEREDWWQVNLRVPETVEWLVKSIKEVTGQGEDAIETERLDAEWVKVRWRKSEGESGFVIDLNGEEYRRYGWLRGMMKVNGSQVLMTTDAKKMELARELIYRCGFGCLVEEQRGTYVLTIPKSRRSGDVRGEKFHKTGNRYYFYHAGHHWTPLRKLRVIGKNEPQYPERVYDLNVKDEHTYVVRELGTVHNSGRRNGSIAIYLEPHHPDILEFMELRKNHGAEEERCRDLFTALWVSDCFMERVEYAQKHPDEEVWWPLIHSSDQPDF